jgi:hypothetical protein
MPGVPEKIHGAEAHDPIPVEDAFRAGREDPVVNRVRSGCICTGRSVWGAGDHNSELAVAEWSAGPDDARAVYGRVGSDPHSAPPNVGACSE